VLEDRSDARGADRQAVARGRVAAGQVHVHAAVNGKAAGDDGVIARTARAVEVAENVEQRGLPSRDVRREGVTVRADVDVDATAEDVRLAVAQGEGADAGDAQVAEEGRSGRAVADHHLVGAAGRR